MADRQPWRLEGTDTRPERPALADALRRLHEGQRGPVPATYDPPVATFAMTKAAHEALLLSRNSA